MTDIDRSRIAAAARRIAGHVRETPVLHLGEGAFGAPGPVSLKLELLQHSGSFKARGAFNALLSGGVPAAGAIAASGGNHGAAVAFAARSLGVKAEIFVPALAPAAKVARLRAYGAEVTVGGVDYAEARAAAAARQAATGALWVDAYDAETTVAGQGTVAREWEAQAPDLDTVLVAVGGGGLIGGIASWYRNSVKVVAVETEGCPTLHAARAAGGPVVLDSVSGVAADSLGARRIGDVPFAANPFIADSVLVPDAAVREAQRALWAACQIVAEPGGATALAALVSGAYRPAKGERVGVLVCGANCDPASVTGNG
ncbi:MAG TPA: serine/threonine dehydratase [Azospirillaceae bacterium]|nr:serine/threonine dehydratase [Azospirillaceae bacterium]